MSDSDELTPRRYGNITPPAPNRRPGITMGEPVRVVGGQVGTSSDWAENKSTIFDGPGYHLQSRLDTLQTSTDGLTTDVSTINGEITTINGEINGLIGEGGSVPTLQDDVATLQGDVTALQNKTGVIDARQFALIRARQLGVFSSAPTAFEDEFSTPPLASPSKWLRSIVAGGSATQLADERGGVVRVSSGATAFATQTVSLGPASGNLPGLISDPGTNGSNWYLLWIFRIPTTVDAETSNLLNVVGVVTTPSELFFGVDGRFASTTKLMAEWSDNTTSIHHTLSDVDISPGTWHYLEAYQKGDGTKVFFRYDGESEKTLIVSAPFNHAATLQLTSDNGATLSVKSIDTDHLVLLMDNNVTLQTG